MATHAGMKARRIAGNAAGVVGIEMLAAAQGLDFHAPLRTAPSLRPAVAAIRAKVPFYASDRYLADDLGWAKQAVIDGLLCLDVPESLF